MIISNMDASAEDLPREAGPQKNIEEASRSLSDSVHGSPDSFGYAGTRSQQQQQQQQLAMRSRLSGHQVLFVDRHQRRNQIVPRSMRFFSMLAKDIYVYLEAIEIAPAAPAPPQSPPPPLETKEPGIVHSEFFRIQMSERMIRIRDSPACLGLS